MTNQEKFSNAVLNFLTQVEVLDKDNTEDLYVEENGKKLYWVSVFPYIRQI